MPVKTLRIIIFCGILAIGAMMIFIFSDQTGDRSHEESKQVSRVIVRVFDKTFSWGLSEYDIVRFTNLADGPVRKLAHIMIYTGLSIGVVIGFAIVRWGRPRPADYFIDIGIAFAIAVADEINQYYSGGRGSNVADVFIDVVGAILGVMFMHSVISLISWIKARHTDRKIENSNGLKPLKEAAPEDVPSEDAGNRSASV
ncbi:MAG: VanZ family protein [Lachnospiraceae bacterium]|nr:VanZ family protein [Lachnospiraceae bacterium]